MQELQDLELALKPAGEEIVRDGWGMVLKSRLLADCLSGMALLGRHAVGQSRCPMFGWLDCMMAEKR